MFVEKKDIWSDKIMTIIIWIGSLLFITIINTLIGQLFGFKAGMLIVYIVWFWIAKNWTSSYKQSRHEHTFEFISQYTPKEILDKCEILRSDKEQLIMYLKSCVKNKDISKLYSKILNKEFKDSKKVSNDKIELNTYNGFVKVSYCRICGAALIENSNFCCNCGTKIVIVEEKNYEM